MFNQIEHWSVPKSLFFHFFSIYITYAICYLVNSWIPFEPTVLLIFTLVFGPIFLVIWFTVFIPVKAVSKRLNANIK